MRFEEDPATPKAPVRLRCCYTDSGSALNVTPLVSTKGPWAVGNKEPFLAGVLDGCLGLCKRSSDKSSAQELEGASP